MQGRIISVLYVWQRMHLELRAVQLMDNIVAFQTRPDHCKDEESWTWHKDLCVADFNALVEDAFAAAFLKIGD